MKIKICRISFTHKFLANFYSKMLTKVNANLSDTDWDLFNKNDQITNFKVANVLKRKERTYLYTNMQQTECSKQIIFFKFVTSVCFCICWNSHTCIGTYEHSHLFVNILFFFTNISAAFNSFFHFFFNTLWIVYGVLN